MPNDKPVTTEIPWNVVRQAIEIFKEYASEERGIIEAYKFMKSREDGFTNTPG